MVSSKGVAAPAAAAPNQEAAAAFLPPVWGDYFVTYNPPLSQRSEEWMRERAGQLMGDVRRMFEAGKGAMSVAGAVTFVDTLERLGVDNHFREEIGAALNRVRGEEPDSGGSDHDLHVVALRFRLLRQHGLWVSADVFNKFKDGAGSFDTSLSSDPRGLLSLYNAAHMATPGEATLDDAIAFARRHLEAMKGELRSPLAEQVSRALDIPLPRLTRRIETMHYIAEYEQEETHDGTLLELARLDFNLVRSLHLKELKALSLWWRDLYDIVKLSYARDRLVETYFWACGVFHEEEYSRARIIFAKTFGILSLMDDTYDVHATLEECHKLNEAIQRWDEGAVTILPEYMHMFYIKLLSSFKEFEDSLLPNEKYRMSYLKKTYKLQSEYYLEEAKWSNKNYQPNFKEHMDLSVPSSGLLMLSILSLVGMGVETNKEALEWAIGIPDVINASGELGRFLNDIAAHKMGKAKKDMASSVECYAKEHGVTGEEAVAALGPVVEGGWRTINRARMVVKPELVPTTQVVLNQSRMLEIIYLGGRDAYTFSGDLKDLVFSQFLKPVPFN